MSHPGRVAAGVLFLVAVVAAMLAFPSRVVAGTLTLGPTQLLALWDVFETPESAATTLDSKARRGEAVIFTGMLADTADNPFSPFAQIGIGANFRGVSSTGRGATVSTVLGSHDIRGFADYALTFRNLGDEPRSVSLFLTTGFTDAPFFDPANFYQSGFVRLDPGASARLMLDFDTLDVVNRHHTSGIGFQVGGDIDRDPESFRVQVGVVPAPATASLLLISTLAFALRRRWRRAARKEGTTPA